jgi:MFS family permease
VRSITELHSDACRQVYLRSGVGGIWALTEALTTDLIPLRQRGIYFALIGIVWSLGSVSGLHNKPFYQSLAFDDTDGSSHSPLVGGVLAQEHA